jgi:hypothetical protein
LGIEDEICIEYVFELLQAPDKDGGHILDGRKMTILLTGFLESHTKSFMASLWTLLISASSEASGIPSELLDQKKKELDLQRVSNFHLLTSRLRRRK